MTLAACGPTGPAPEAISLLGEPLHRPELTEETRARLQQDLDAARANYAADPTDEERIIWLGRRLGYLGRYNDAIHAFSGGLDLHPDSYRLLRHRGHRLISTRRLEEAIADLSLAAELIEGLPDEVELDGAPNDANIPRSTSHSNIWYHLGLAYYLTGDYESAAAAYRHGLAFCANDDMLVATSHWLYMTLRRLGRDQEAADLLEPVHADMQILESFAYHDLLRMYKGDLAPETIVAGVEQDDLGLATAGYGVANWYFMEGSGDGKKLLDRIVAESGWAAFGHIAAEADLARRQDPAHSS